MTDKLTIQEIRGAVHSDDDTNLGRILYQLLDGSFGEAGNYIINGYNDSLHRRLVRYASNNRFKHPLAGADAPRIGGHLHLKRDDQMRVIGFYLGGSFMASVSSSDTPVFLDYDAARCDLEWIRHHFNLIMETIWISSGEPDNFHCLRAIDLENPKLIHNPSFNPPMIEAARLITDEYSQSIKDGRIDSAYMSLLFAQSNMCRLLKVDKEKEKAVRMSLNNLIIRIADVDRLRTHLNVALPILVNRL